MLGKTRKLPGGDETFWTLNKGQNIDSEVASSNDYKDQLNMAEQEGRCSVAHVFQENLEFQFDM